MSTTKKLTRHEIKEPDPFVVGAEHTIQFVRSHRPRVIAVAVVAVLLTITAAFTVNRIRSARAKASLSLVSLLETARRPVTTEPVANPGGQAPQPFASQVLKDEVVARESSDLLKSFGATPSARGAKMLHAQVLARRGDHAEASKLYAEVSGTVPTDVLGAAAAIARAEVTAASGKVDEAIADLKRLASTKNHVLPSDLALLRAAEIAGKAGRDGEALALYKQIVLESTNPSIRGQAETKAAEYEAKTPPSAEAAGG